MKVIGIDFDNTIINYDKVFYSLALKKKIIRKNILIEKEAIKNYLIQNNFYNEWISLQGEVYSKHVLMGKTNSFFIPVLKKLLKKYELHIISHKTLYPVIGEKINLRDQALKWIEKKIISKVNFKRENIHFASTQNEKIKIIKIKKCNIFIDDLEDILVHNKFPKKCKKILFNDQIKQNNNNEIYLTNNWNKIYQIITELDN